MVKIPVLQEVVFTRCSPSGSKPIMQLKELEPDWERYNAWRASLVESYANWVKRRKRLRLDSTF